MKNYLLLSCLMLLSLTAAARNPYIINADGYTDAQLAAIKDKVPKDGWIMVDYQGEQYIQNYSNSDYDLGLSLVCKDAKSQPGYLIEYSKNYGDGDFGGVDFLSSARSDYAKIVFYVDGKNLGNPFSKPETKDNQNFAAILKSGKLLTIEVYDEMFNPDSGETQLTLNRSIDFKLGHSALLDTVVNCNPS